MKNTNKKLAKLVIFWYNKYMKNIEINSQIIHEIVTISREEYDNLIAENTRLKAEVKALTDKVNWLMEIVKLDKNKMFGS